MGHVKHVLDTADIPVTLEEMGTRLNAISDAINSLSRKGNKNPALSHDFDGLLDFWHYVELARANHAARSGDPDAKNGSLGATARADEEYPHTDPVTMLTLAERYRVIPADEASELKAEFMAKASAAAGCALKPAQIKKLFTLFRSYNPVGHRAPD